MVMEIANCMLPHCSPLAANAVIHAKSQGSADAQAYLEAALQSQHSKQLQSRQHSPCLSQLIDDFLLCGLRAPLEALLHAQERLKQTHANLMSMGRDAIQIGSGDV